MPDTLENLHTIPGLLRSRSDALGDSPFVTFEGVTWSYRETLRRSTVVATALQALGVHKADKVGIMLENRLEYVAAIYGLALAGAVQVPINLEHRGAVLESALRSVEPTVIICEDYLLETLASALRGAEHSVRTVVTVRNRSADAYDQGVPGVQSVITWEKLLEGGSDDDRTLPIRGFSELSIVMLTSGTTGVSKGVMCTEKHGITHAREAAEAFGLTSDDVLYTCLPLFHGNAQFSSLTSALVSGASLVLSRRFSAKRFWAEVADSGATQVALLGALLHILMAQPEHPDEKRHRVRIGTSAPCPMDVMLRFERRFGFPLIETYGTTETKRILSNRHYHRRIGSLGYPTPSSIVEIQDEMGRSVPAGEIGEIVYRPKEPGILTLGYLNQPSATLDSLVDGWWHTGDLGWRDDDNFFYFAGRKKDALRRRGENISAFEVETAIMSHPHVALAAVVAAPSDISEDEVMAVVVPAHGAHVQAPEVFMHADSRLPYFMVPRYIAIVDSLPMTPTGKINKGGLVEAVEPTLVWDSEAAGFTATRARDLKHGG